MIVRKDSWHYNLAKNKTFVSNPKIDNADAIAYIGEVWISIFVKYLIIPLLITMVCWGMDDIGMIMVKYPGLVITFVIVVSSPVWFCLLLLIIEPFTRKRWRKLEIVD